MRVIGSLSRPAAGHAPIVSELENAFVLAQIDSMIMLLQPLSAMRNTGTRNGNNDIMCEEKLERELRQWK